MLARLDAAIRRRSKVGWVAFRFVAGAFALMGLLAWITLWFQRNFWLGLSQVVMCGAVLANELGLLRSRRGAQ